jgi:hypothetical protein
MLINKATGEVSLAGDIILIPNVPLATFQSLKELDQWKLLVSSEPACLYERTIIDYKARRLTVKVLFRATSLYLICLSYFLEDELNSRVRRIIPGKWGSDEERRELHKNILAEELGGKPYNYEWGFVDRGSGGIDLTDQILIHFTGRPSVAP